MRALQDLMRVDFTVVDYSNYRGFACAKLNQFCNPKVAPVSQEQEMSGPV